MFTIQKALKLMRSGGSIVATGSIGGHAYVSGNTTYAASKAGLYAALKVIAGELVHKGIKVNMVSPGPIETPLLHRNPGISGEAVDKMRGNDDCGRSDAPDGTPRGSGPHHSFFASDEASFITAANLFVDGGTLKLG